MRRFRVIIKNLISLPKRLFNKISILSIISNSTIDKSAAICTGSRFYRSRIGRYSYIGRNTFVTNSTIGNFSSIGGGCNIGGTSHPLDWVSTSPVFHKWDNILRKNFFRHEFDIFQETFIGNDVWIATNCLIKAGVKIDNGAVVGMGSVVTKDIGPYEIWAGNPARLIRKRFDNEVIDILLHTEWWNWSDEKIEACAECFNDINKFIEINKCLHMEDII